MGFKLVFNPVYILGTFLRCVDLPEEVANWSLTSRHA